MAVAEPATDTASRDVPGWVPKWFYAAAVYNVLWGGFAILFPNLAFELSGAPLPQYPSLFQCIGMIVMVYALGYYYIARDPVRYAPFVWIGLLGKTFGPIGFVYAVWAGELPLVFGVNILFNDLIWWPAFWIFALRYARDPLLLKSPK
ncbi:MAG: alkyl hydroperoxide reductase [Fimbriimonadaceae bacterium]